METLEKVLAHRVLDALRARELLLVSAPGSDALTGELEAIIGPTLGTISAHLESERSRRRPARHVLKGSLGDGAAEDAALDLVERITEQLMESDHVDDIYAEDRIIRRDTHRAIREILLGYIRGELAVDVCRRVETFEVALATLGYVVEMVCERLGERELVEVLERAATREHGRLVAIDHDTRIASFALPGGPEVGRLGIEEAITEAMTELVRDHAVCLPAIEQVLEVTADASAHPDYDKAVARAERKARRTTGSDATCRLIDPSTVIVTLTPLSRDAAEHAEAHFQAFIGILERELLSLEPVASDPPSSSKPASTSGEPARHSRTRRRGSRKAPRKRAR